MTDDQARAAQAVAAIDAFISESLVFLTPPRGKLRDTWVGSGVMLLTATGTAVLTAAHNLEDLPRTPLSMGGRCIRGTLDDVIESFATHPTEDVGFVRLRAHVAQSLAPFALPVEGIGTDDALDPERDQFKLAGFPSAMTLLDAVPGGASVGLVSVCHGTTLKTPPVDDRGRLRVDWSSGVFQGGAPVAMPHPRGISGGGLWRLFPVPKGAVWHPSACAKLIGVATAFSVDTEFVVPESKWRTWLLECAASK